MRSNFSTSYDAQSGEISGAKLPAWQSIMRAGSAVWRQQPVGASWERGLKTEVWSRKGKAEDPFYMRLRRAWQGAFSRQLSAFSGNRKGFLYLPSSGMAGFKITLYAGSAPGRPLARPALQNKEQA